jgi:acyl-CoA thioester hydrolase
VGVRTTKLGNKSMQMEQCIAGAEDDIVYAAGKVVLVAYDYATGKSVPIPDEWRDRFAAFEGL